MSFDKESDLGRGEIRMRLMCLRSLERKALSGKLEGTQGNGPSITIW
jgi:hypothetical protein